MKLATIDIEDGVNANKCLSDELDELLDKSPSEIDIKEVHTAKTSLNDRMGCRSTNKSLVRVTTDSYFKGKETPSFKSETKNISKRMERFTNGDISTAKQSDKYRLKSSSNHFEEFKLPNTLKSRDDTQWSKSKKSIFNNDQFKQQLIDDKLNDSEYEKSIDLDKVQREIDRIKSRRTLNNKIRSSNKTECVVRQPTEANDIIAHKHLNEITIPDFVGKDNDSNSTIRWYDFNFQSNKQSWLNKNMNQGLRKNCRDSFMPTLSPLPSLMKKFGEHTKDEKQRREYSSAQFHSPLCISNNRHNISQNNDNGNRNQTMHSTDNFGRLNFNNEQRSSDYTTEGAAKNELKVIKPLNSFKNNLNTFKIYDKLK
jgi:hypothetical protein